MARYVVSVARRPSLLNELVSVGQIPVFLNADDSGLKVAV
jgi:hypothetical protein